GPVVPADAWFGTDRVTPVSYTSYAVDVQTGHLTRWKPDAPAAAWYLFFFFTKHLHRVQMFCEKEWKSSALPEAISPAKRGIV
ncbi:MAG: hypothetical protein ACLFVO_10895, partial [Chloroflexaceae bacterium]